MSDLLDQYDIKIPENKSSKPDLLDQNNIGPKPKYIATPTDTYGGTEKVFVENSGKTVDAPFGSGKFFENNLKDDAFDHGGSNPLRITVRVGRQGGATTGKSNDPSSTIEEFAAGVENQAATVAFVANALGMVTDDEAAPFISDRTSALRSAQERAPEYMKSFNDGWNKADGFFQSMGVIWDHPRAYGRMVVTQAPNSLFPLITGYAGGQAGAITGAAFGSAVPVAGTTAGAITGATVGSIAGSFPGSAMAEIGSQIDELITEAGYDVTNSASLLEALQNDDLMNGIKEKAARKGITTATIDTFFQVFGGRFVRLAKGAGGKVAGGVADVGIQSVGEFSGEAGGQFARDGDVNWKDAMLEGMTSVGQSVGQTALGASARGGMGIVRKVGASTPEQISEAETAVQEIADAAVAETQAQDIAETSVAETAPAEVQKIVNDFMNGVEPDTSQYSEAKQAAIQDVLDKAKPVRDKIIRGRIRKLDNDIEAKLQQIDAAEAELSKAREEGKGTKRREARLEKMALEWEAMDAERGELFSIENPLTESADLLDKNITVKGDVLENQNIKATKRTLMAVNSAFRQARVATKQGIKSVQKSLAAAIRQSGLSEADQNDFTGAITSIQTIEQLKKQAPKIQARIEAKLNEARKASALADLKAMLRRIKKSNVIAIDYVKKIESLFNDIDVQKRSEKSINSLQATLDHVEKTGDDSIPKGLLKKLEVLNKRRIEDVSASELEDIAETIRSLVDQGKTKLKLIQARDARTKQKRLEELKAGSVKLSDQSLRRAPLGEKLGIMDRVKNKFTEGVNRAQRLNINKNPMDVIFDIMDGYKQYQGANHRIFKQTIDRAFGAYLDIREAGTRAVKELHDELKLTPEQYDRIGAYAAAQQEGGIDKLRASGIPQSDIEDLALSPDEMRMYELMREKLDSMAPMLKEVMRLSYNKDFEGVENYFPFMTDFQAMDGYEIQDMFGDNAPVIGKKKNVEQGFTLSRTLGKQKIRIDAMDIFLKHMDNASYLIGMGKDIKDLSDVAVSNEFGDTAGDVGQDVVTDWLNLLARKGTLPNQVNFIDTFRRNVGAATLGFKLSSIFIQPTSLLDGASFVGGTYVSRGIQDVTNKEWRKFLRDNMPEIRERAGDDPAYMDLGGDALASIREAGYWALKNMDLLSASAVAAGAYRKSVEQRGGEVDLSNPDPEALRDAQLAVRRTQSSGFFKDSAPIISQGKLTGNPSIDRLILQFQSFVINRWSLIQHDMFNAGLMQGRTKQAVNIATWLILANISENFIRHWTKEMIAAAMGTEPPKDDEEDDLANKIIAQAIGNVPVVGSIVNSFEYGSVPVPAISMVEKISETIQYGNKSKAADKQARHYGSAAILTTGLMLGIPGTLQAQQLYSSGMKEFVVDDKKKKAPKGIGAN